MYKTLSYRLFYSHIFVQLYEVDGWTQNILLCWLFCNLFDATILMKNILTYFKDKPLISVLIVRLSEKQRSYPYFWALPHDSNLQPPLTLNPPSIDTHNGNLRQVRDERGSSRKTYCAHFSVHQREILYFEHVKRAFSKCLIQVKVAVFYSRHIIDEETI